MKMSLNALSASSYEATVSHLPYATMITFSVAVTSAAGLRPLSALVRATILHPAVKARQQTRRNGRKSKGGSQGPLGVGPIGQ